MRFVCTVVAGAIAITAFVGLPAHAGYSIVGTAPEDPCETPAVTEVGQRGDARPLIVSPRSESIEAAVAQVVPRDWSVRGLPGDAVVSWQGGPDWITVLKDLGIKAGFCVKLDHAEKVATFRAGPSPAAQPQYPGPQEASGSEAEAEAEPVESTTSMPDIALASPNDAVAAAEPEAELPPAEDVVTFSLKGGDTLKETFDRWCSDAGWTLQWRADHDYPIDSGYQFPAGTEFRQAVRETLGAYWGKRQALIGRAYKNNVLVISGRGEHE